MSLSFYNSKTRKKEKFEPQDPNKVRIYSCGPTVYNHNHIGNFRAYVFVDLLRRYLKYKGFVVEHTINITDVEDKIIQNALSENKEISEFTEKYTKAYLEDLSYLRIEEVEHRPKATESIPEMIAMIEGLLAKGHAYQKDGSIYFRIESFSDYGRLSGVEPEMLRTAAEGRFDADEYKKEDVRDFALWKKSTKEDAKVKASWEAPFGKGRPGWHLECSAMIRKIYGMGGIDIHTGGIDLLFPHHENEIAQSCCNWPQENFVRYWLHNEHLLVEGKKMSKSLGNFFTLRELSQKEKAASLVQQNRAPKEILELIAKGQMQNAIRYLLLSTHYRQKLNFTFLGLSAAARSIERIEEVLQQSIELLASRPKEIARNAEKFLRKNQEKKCNPIETQSRIYYQTSLAQKLQDNFTKALDDDLNISRALSAIFEAIKKMKPLVSEGKKSLSARRTQELKELLYEFYRINKTLGILDWEGLGQSSGKEGISYGLTASEIQKIESLIQKRSKARKSKNFAEADRIREELLQLNIELEDAPEGTNWKKTK